MKTKSYSKGKTKIIPNQYLLRCTPVNLTKRDRAKVNQEQKQIQRLAENNGFDGHIVHRFGPTG